MREAIKRLTFKKVLFGLILAVTLVTSGWSLAALLIGYGVPKLIAIGAVVVYDFSAIYYGKTAMEYATTDDSGVFERYMTWVMVLMSVAINGYHGWVTSPALGIVLGSIPAVTGTLHHSSLKQGNLGELRRKGRLAKAMPKFPLLHWFLFPKKTFTSFREIAGSRLNALVNRALNEEKEFPLDSPQWGTVGECVRDNLHRFPTLDEMAGFVGKQFPQATRSQVSNAMSRERGKKN